MGLLEHIETPADLRDLPQSQLNALADEIRQLLIQKVSATGGHLGPNLGVVELTNVGNRIQSSTFQPVETLITVGVTYLVLTTLVTQVTAAIEYRFDVEGRNQ